MKNIIMHKEGEQSWITWIKKRIKNNLNFLAIATGETGIGKSWALIRIAYDIDNTFESRQIAFSFKQVMEIINSDWFNKKKWKVIIFDEAQCDISNRQWQSLTNKLMNYLLSTFRHRNIILLFTSPYSDFLDSHTQKLIHCKLEIRGHSRKKKMTQIRPKLLQYNPKKKKFYEHSLYSIKNRKSHKLVYWFITKPPEHLVIPYEKDKIEFTNKLNQNIIKDLEELENSKHPKEKSILDIGTTKQRQAKRLYVKYKGDLNKVAKEIGIVIKNVRGRLKGSEGMADLNDIIEKLQVNTQIHTDKT